MKLLYRSDSWWWWLLCLLSNKINRLGLVGKLFNQCMYKKHLKLITSTTEQAYCEHYYLLVFLCVCVFFLFFPGQILFVEFLLLFPVSWEPQLTLNRMFLCPWTPQQRFCRTFFFFPNQPEWLSVSTPTPDLAFTAALATHRK